MNLQLLLPARFREDAARRIFCFPHAGGGTAVFYRWDRYLPDDVALGPLRLPGRDDRLREAPYSDLLHLADDAANAIRSLRPKPYVLVGHSFGGYVALEVVRRLVLSGYPPPAALIVAACGAPRPGKAQHPIGQLPDKQFVDEVARRYDGIPEAVLANAELLAMVVPALRADLQMVESYDNPSNAPVPCDLLALGGTDDPGVAPSRLNEWRALTTGNFTMRLFPGGHFFLHPPARRDMASDSRSMPAPLALVLNSLPPNDGISP